MKTVTYDETAWQLVPKEPIDEMVNNAFAIRDGDITKQTIIGIYKDMLEDAPEAPAQHAYLDIKEFEVLAKSQGLQDFTKAKDKTKEGDIPKTHGGKYFPATYYNFITELAWRVWANKSAPAQPAPAHAAIKAAAEAGVFCTMPQAVEFARLVNVAQPVTDHIPDVGKTIQPVNAQDAKDELIKLAREALETCALRQSDGMPYWFDKDAVKKALAAMQAKGDGS